MSNDQGTLWADVNGEIVPAGEARVSVWDRGFLFGDSVFEAIRIHRARPVLWDVHMLRLMTSAQGIRFEHLPEPADLRRRVEALIERSGLQSGTIYMQISRGEVGKRSDTEMPTRPTVFISVDGHTCLPEENYRDGVSVITFEDIRWQHANLKITNLLPRTFARIEANRMGAHEALFRAPDGHVYEGTSTNLFIHKNGVLTTPPLSDRLLAGATRAALLSVAGHVADQVREADVMMGDLLDADEVMLCGTTTEVLGVIRVDGQQVADGKVGTVTRGLRRLYQETVLEKD